MPSVSCTIRRVGGGLFEFHLDTPGGERVCRSVVGARDVPGLREFARCMRPPAWDQPAASCRKLLEQVQASLGSLVPEGVRELLAESGTPRVLKLRTEERDLPWELARWDEKTLAERFQVARQPRHDLPPCVIPGDRPRALIVSDPEGLLPWAGSLVARLRAVLEPRVEVEALVGVSANQGEVVDRLASGDYLLAFLCALRSEDGLLLADGKLRPGDLEGAAPAMVCFEVHRAGRGSPDESLPGWCVTWADALLERGARAVVAPLWDPSDAGAAVLQEQLARQLMQGATVGEALGRARLEVPSDDPYLTRFAFAAHGDLEFQLPGVSPAQRQPATVASRLKAFALLRVTQGPEEDREIRLYAEALEQGQPVTIGGPGLKSNDIDLDDPEMENQACSLLYEGGTLYLQTPSGDPGRVRVNGLPLHGRFALHGGERIELGQTALELELTGSNPLPAVTAGPAGQRFFLEVVQGLPADQGRKLSVQAGFSVVGRQPECQFQLHDPAVSRQQFALVSRQDEIELVHVGSNPTLVNGVPVERHRELQHGDVVQLSETTRLRLLDSGRSGGDRAGS